MAIKLRNDPVRLFGRRLMILILLILVVGVAWGAWGAYKKERESAALRVEAEGQLNDLTVRQIQLDEDIANLQTDRGVEAVLREQYELAREGEGLIVIVDKPETSPSQATSTMLDSIKGAFFRW